MSAGYYLDGRLSPSLARVAYPVVFVGVVAIAGVLCAFLPWFLPWWAPIVLLGGLGLAAATAFYPLIGFIAAIFLTVQVIPPQFAPEIPIGPIKLAPGELIFLWTIFVFAARTALAREAGKLELPRFTLPVAYILACAAVGVVYGKYFQNNGTYVLAEARGFLGLLTIPLVQLLVRDRREMERLCFWLSAAGVVVSIYIIIQASTGIPILGGRLEALDLANSDVMRSVAPTGSVQAFSLFYLTLSLWTGRRFRYWLIPLIFIVLLGLLGTFGRGLWMTTALGGLIAAFLAGKWRGLLIAVVAGTTLITATLGATFVVKPRMAEAAIDRVLGIGMEVDKGDSFGWRQKENEIALKVIRENPLLGVGLGGAYKNVASSRGHFDVEYYFIHNSYLYFPLKMGLPAALGPLLLTGTFVLLFLRVYRRTGGLVGPVVAACTGLVVAMHISAWVGPTLRTFPGLLMLGIALGLCAATYRLLQEPPTNDGPRSAPEAGSTGNRAGRGAR